MINKNDIYKIVYDEVRDISNWCYGKDVTGREVGNYLDGIIAVSERLLKEIDKNMEK